jgi:hypothetical protein
VFPTVTSGVGHLQDGLLHTHTRLLDFEPACVPAAQCLGDQTTSIVGLGLAQLLKCCIRQLAGGQPTLKEGRLYLGEMAVPAISFSVLPRDTPAPALWCVHADTVNDRTPSQASPAPHDNLKSLRKG